MNKYTPINGYTKRDILWYLKTFNDGTKSVNPIGGGAAYKDGDNHCAVGCFIPHGHAGMQHPSWYGNLMHNYPDLEEYMPLEATAMHELQKVHDNAYFAKDAGPNMRKWVMENVK